MSRNDLFAWYSYYATSLTVTFSMLISEKISNYLRRQYLYLRVKNNQNNNAETQRSTSVVPWYSKSFAVSDPSMFLVLFISPIISYIFLTYRQAYSEKWETFRIAWTTVAGLRLVSHYIEKKSRRAEYSDSRRGNKRFSSADRIHDTRRTRRMVDVTNKRSNGNLVSCN